MKTLVIKAQRGDTDAFARLIERMTMDLYKVARGILNNKEDIADAIQNTVLICFEKLTTLRQPAYFKTWMIRILINECNQIIRSYGKERQMEEFWEPADENASMEQLEFCQLLEALDEKYRLIFLLYYGEGFKVSEIAQVLDLKEGTVKTRLSRGREALAKEYGIERKKSGVLSM